MKLVILSDTHGLHDRVKVPPGDVLIHCGDFTKIGHPVEIIKFNAWLSELPHARKLIVAGNHDTLLEKEHSLAKGWLTDCTYLQDEEVVIDGIKFYGTPWQPEFRSWAFNLPRDGEEIESKWANIPDDVEVLITHCPPYGILDMNREGELIGCKRLYERLKDLKKLKHHAFGHIHEGYGIYPDPEGIFINASICTRDYIPSNLPIVVEV